MAADFVLRVVFEGNRAVEVADLQGHEGFRREVGADGEGDFGVEGHLARAGGPRFGRGGVAGGLGHGKSLVTERFEDAHFRLPFGHGAEGAEGSDEQDGPSEIMHSNHLIVKPSFRRVRRIADLASLR